MNVILIKKVESYRLSHAVLVFQRQNERIFVHTNNYDPPVHLSSYIMIQIIKNEWSSMTSTIWGIIQNFDLVEQFYNLEYNHEGDRT